LQIIRNLADGVPLAILFWGINLQRAQPGTAAKAFARQRSADCPQTAAVDFWEALRVGTTRAPALVPDCPHI